MVQSVLYNRFEQMALVTYWGRTSRTESLYFTQSVTGYNLADLFLHDAVHIHLHMKIYSQLFIK